MTTVKKSSLFPRVHLIHGLKTALAATLAYALTLGFNLEFGYWAVISTVIVMQVYVADSVSMCLYRFSGTLVGAALGLCVLLAVPPGPIWTGAALFASVGLCSFMTHYNTRYRMAAITLAIIIMTGDTSHQPLVFCLDRVWEISIGIGCAFFVSVAVFPSRKLDLLTTAFKTQAQECCKRYDALIGAFLNGQTPVEDGFLDDLVESIRQNHDLFQAVKRHESLIYQRKFRSTMAATLACLDRVAEHLRTMARTLNTPLGRGFDIIMEKELLDLARTTKETLVRFVDNPDAVRGDSLAAALAAAQKRLESLRAQGVTTRFDLPKLVQVFSFYHSMHYLAEDLIHAAGSRS